MQGGKTIAVDLAIESSAFEALEKDVMEVLQEVMGDKNLDGFKVEYEKLHQALKNSHEAEKRLVKKCRELNNDITTNASKVQAALKVAQDEQQLIMQMKKDIERAWKTVEASHEKESNMKQQIQTLRAGIAELNESIEQGSGMTSTQDSTIVELGRQRDELQTQREELVARIMQAHPRPHPPPTLTNRHQCGCMVVWKRCNVACLWHSFGKRTPSVRGTTVRLTTNASGSSVTSKSTPRRSSRSKRYRYVS